MHYLPTTTPDGSIVVARVRCDGVATVECDAVTWEAAVARAESLNRIVQAKEMLDSLARLTGITAKPRRAVRYFEPDAFL